MPGTIGLLNINPTELFDTFCFNYPQAARSCIVFRRCLVKAHKVKTRLQFLKMCMAEHLVPNSSIPLRLRGLDGTPFGRLERIVAQHNIKKLKKEVDDKFSELLTARNNLCNVLSGHLFHFISNVTYEIKNETINNLKILHLRRKSDLIKNNVWDKSSNNEFFLNLSSKQLGNNTQKALGFGLNFSFNHGSPNMLEIAKRIDRFERRYEGNRDIIKGMIYGSINAELNFNSIPIRYINALKKLKADREIHISKADKSSKIIIMDKNDYIMKCESFLNNENSYKPLEKYNISYEAGKFHGKMRNILGQENAICKYATTKTPSLSYFYALIKTHKENNPIRPIVSTQGSVLYKLSKSLANILSKSVGKISDSHVINNLDLIKKIKGIEDIIDYDYELISFDVVNLYGSIPINELLEFLEEYLEENPSRGGGLTSKQVIDLIKLIGENSVFTFNGKIYKQIFGLSMGNSLSPVLANLYMEFFEMKILRKIKSANIYWLRYMDDVLCFFPKNLNLNLFFEQLNNLSNCIKFTREREQNGQIAFLDVRLLRIDDCIKFDVYRKPQNICSYIHYFSNHEYGVKTSVFMGMFSRAFSICSMDFLELEIRKIYSIGMNLKYPLEFLEKCKNKVLKNLDSHSVELEKTLEFGNVITLPYHPTFRNLKFNLKKLNIKLIFTYEEKIKSKLISNKPLDKRQNGVYSIVCKNCNKIYYGHTGQGLQKRVGQHANDIKKITENPNFHTNNSLAIHVGRSGHTIDLENSKIIFKSDDYNKRVIVESACIQITKSSNLTPWEKTG